MALETIYSRCSIRKYTDKQVSRHIIEQIIDAGRVISLVEESKALPHLGQKRLSVLIS